jgi:hypothetical protein
VRAVDAGPVELAGPGPRVAHGPESYRLVTCGVMYGDEHVVPRAFLGLIPYRHYGIELPDGTMCENSPAGVRVVGFADFARGRPSRVANPDASPDVRALAVQRAMSRVGERRYSLSGNNCEHFATWCATGIAVSQQVIAWISSFFRIALAAAGALHHRPRTGRARTVSPQHFPPQARRDGEGREPGPA